MPPRVSAVPSRRGHLPSVLRDETLRHRLFRARQATRRASLRAPSRLRDGPAPRPRRNRLHELGAGDRDLSGGSQGGNLQKSQNMRDGPEWRDAIPALWTKVGS